MSADPLAELPVGSSAYYLARLARPEHRAATAAALGFAIELERSVARCQDPGATRLKLDWWRQELTRAADSAHPLARRLAPLAEQSAGLQALGALLDAAESDVRHLRPADPDGFAAQCADTGRLAELLCLAAGQAVDPGPLGTYAAAVARIQGLRTYLQRGHNPLPSAFTPDGDWHAWPEEARTRACEALLTPLRQAAERALADRADATRPARRWAAQARARHRLLARTGYPVSGAPPDITPITRLWTAWRVR